MLYCPQQSLDLGSIHLLIHQIQGCGEAIILPQLMVTVRYYESKLLAQLIPTHHPKPKGLLINHLLCLCIYTLFVTSITVSLLFYQLNRALSAKEILESNLNFSTLDFLKFFDCFRICTFLFNFVVNLMQLLTACDRVVLSTEQ